MEENVVLIIGRLDCLTFVQQLRPWDTNTSSFAGVKIVISQ
uniref:Uncharacterized protein n=1 Tax=Tetranychus urticae TaxID=32264 RepID=T1JRZ9_TETUR